MTFPKEIAYLFGFSTLQIIRATLQPLNSQCLCSVVTFPMRLSVIFSCVNQQLKMEQPPAVSALFSTPEKIIKFGNP